MPGALNLSGRTPTPEREELERRHELTAALSDMPHAAAPSPSPSLSPSRWAPSLRHLVCALAGLVALTVAALGAAPVGAHRLAFPGQRPLHDPRVDRMVVLGERYWRTRHVTPCAKPVVRVAASLSSDDGHQHDGYAQMGGCQVWLRTGYLDGSLRSGDRDRLRVLCAIVVHELGHTAGLRHTRSGIMKPSIGSADEPPECSTAFPGGSS